MSPNWLVKKLDRTKGRIEGSTATFGAPFYGDRVLGRLVWGESKGGHHHCTPEDYDLPDEDTVTGSTGWKEKRLINVAVVRRGKCSFVTKVRVASAKGAHAVIIVDRPDSPLSEEDLKNIIVADDGWGSNIHIPSVLVTKEHGEELITAAKSDKEAIVELAWNAPPDHVVTMDLWMSSASTESMNFLRRFADRRRTLNEVVEFIPHYNIFSMDPSLGGYNDLCSDTSAQYCTEDPDKSGPITGSQVLEEDVRQLCIHDITKVPRKREASERFVFFAEQWWRYIEKFPHECPVDGPEAPGGNPNRFGLACSERLQAALSIDVTKVQDCVRNTRLDKMEQQRKNKAWSPRALRINGWRYTGMLDADLVTRAVCSGFVQEPPECKQLVEPRNPFEKFGAKPEPAGIGFGTLFFSLAGVGLAVLVAVYLHKRYLTKSMYGQIREQVTLEVQSQMDTYQQMR